MKRFMSGFSLGVLILLLFSIQNTFAQKKVYSAFYEGKLNIQTVSLRLVLKTYNKEDGTLGAALDSPDQSSMDIPVSSITMNEDSLKFEIQLANGKYSGKIIKDSSLVKGIWSQSGMNLTLNLKKVDQPSEVKRPQTPQKPYSYTEEEVVFENNEAKIKLAGTFTFPKDGGSFPAVIMVTGSGPQDRDETLLSHKPFLVIADHLTKNGIAVLRYDDRGVAKSKGNFATATSLDFVSDAIAAVDYLKTRKEINPKKIGVLGHSEGGIIAPLCAINSSDVAFIVMLAGTGVPGKDILLLQSKLISKAGGEKEENLERDEKLSEKIYDVVMNVADNTEAENEIKKLIADSYNSLSPEEKKKADAEKAVVEQSLKQLLTPWFRFFIKYDPRPTLEQVTVPVLALNGTLDLQVWQEQNLPEIEKALKLGGNNNYKIVALEGLNHLFQHAKTGSPTEYSTIEETFSPDALKIISDWLLITTK